eukprot:symbB.v1.2.022867.t1/scaffold2036.1/size91645/5
MIWMLACHMPPLDQKFKEDEEKNKVKKHQFGEQTSETPRETITGKDQKAEVEEQEVITEKDEKADVQEQEVSTEKDEKADVQEQEVSTEKDQKAEVEGREAIAEEDQKAEVEGQEAIAEKDENANAKKTKKRKRRQDQQSEQDGKKSFHMAERPKCWNEQMEIVPPDLQAPKKPRGAKKKEKRQAKKEELAEAEAKRKEQEELKEIKDNNTSKRRRKTMTPSTTGGSAKGSGTKVLPGPTLPLDSHPDRVREYLEKWGMVAPSTGRKTERPDEPKNSERPKKRIKKTPEEEAEAKKLRSRKCCAYQKARNQALAAGMTAEEAKKMASEAGG